MNKLIPALLLALAFVASSGCGKKQQNAAPEHPAAVQSAAPQSANPQASAAANAAAPATAQESAPAAPTETVSETEDAQESAEPTPSGVQPTLKLAAAAGGAPTSEQFKEGTNYRKIVPAQPTAVAPGKVEVLEVFWYGCAHCFALDPALESWRNKGKAQYVEFVRIPAMWNDGTRMHARLFYTAEALGKLEALHTQLFREIHVNGDPLNTVEKMTAFFKKQGVSPDAFQKAFSSFAVESKLQRADFLNRRYRINSVPTFVVNGKYVTDVGQAGGEQQLFALIEELAAHEHGG